MRSNNVITFAQRTPIWLSSPGDDDSPSSIESPGEPCHFGGCCEQRRPGVLVGRGGKGLNGRDRHFSAGLGPHLELLDGRKRPLPRRPGGRRPVRGDLPGHFRPGPRLPLLHRPRGPLPRRRDGNPPRSEEHTSELQSRRDLVCRLLLEKKKKTSRFAFTKKKKKKKTKNKKK